MFSYRLLNLYAVIIIVFLLLTAVYMQLVLRLPPCPLCIMQRLVLMFLGLLFIPGIFHVPKTAFRKYYNFFIFLISFLGMAVAARQVYLQHLPPDAVPACGPGLNFLFQNLPLMDALKMVLLGSGECAKVHWTFLSLSIPEWTLIFFIFFAVIALIQAYRKILFIPQT